MNKYDVRFTCCSYKEVKPSSHDFVYMDPPYANTKGMYFGNFDNTSLFQYINELECDWILSYDGLAGDESMMADVPDYLYKRHVLLKSGNSSFRRVIGKNRHCNVQESLYIGFS